MEAGAARKDTRSIFDVLHPPDAKTTWKELRYLRYRLTARDNIALGRDARGDDGEGIDAAARIYVLDQGQVVEHGTHEELMAAEGAYAELYLPQAAAYLRRAGRESVDA